MTSRNKKPKSIKYKEHLAKVFTLSSRAENELACWRVEKELKIKWSEEERLILHKAESLHTEAEKLVGEVFAKRIGEMAVREARGYE